MGSNPYRYIPKCYFPHFRAESRWGAAPIQKLEVVQTCYFARIHLERRSSWPVPHDESTGFYLCTKLNSDTLGYLHYNPIQDQSAWRNIRVDVADDKRIREQFFVSRIVPICKELAMRKNTTNICGVYRFINAITLEAPNECHAIWLWTFCKHRHAGYVFNNLEDVCRSST